MNTPIYISAEDAIDGVEQRENGALAIDFGDSVAGYGTYTTADGNNMFLWCTISRQSALARRQFLKNMESAADDPETDDWPYDVGTKPIKQSPEERADFLSNTQVISKCASITYRTSLSTIAARCCILSEVAIYISPLPLFITDFTLEPLTTSFTSLRRIFVNLIGLHT